MLRWIALLFFGFIFAFQAVSKNSQVSLGDTTRASQLNIEAIALARAKKYDSAIIIFQNAALEYSEADAWDRFFYVQHTIGYLYNTQHKYSESYHYLDSIDNNYHQRLSPQFNSYQRFYGVIAWNQFSLYNYVKAFHYFALVDKGAAVNPKVKPEQILFSKYYQGVIYQRLGQYDKALKYALEVKHLGEKYSNDSYLGQTYNNLGIIYRNLGEYERALEFYQKAIAFQKLNRAEVNLTQIYNNLGSIYYYLKEYNDALKVINHALAVLNDYTTLYFPVESALVQSKSLVLMEIGDYDQAKIILEHLIARENEKYGEIGAESGMTLVRLGEVYAKLGRYDQSNFYFDQSIAVIQDAIGSKTDKLSEIYNLKGRNYLLTQQYDSALQCFQQSIISLVPDFNELGYADNPRVNAEIFDKVELIEAQYLKSKVLLAMYDATPKVEFLQAASTANETATLLVDIVRRNMLYESSKMNLSKRAKTIYEQAIKIAFLSEKENGLPSSAAVFAAMEKSKAYVLSETLQKAKALGYSNLPESILYKEDSFITKIKVLEARRTNALIRSQDSSELDKLNQQLFSVKESFEEFRQSSTTDNSAYHENILEIEAFQRNMSTNELVIEYFAGEKQLYAIALSRTGTKVYQLGPYNDQINTFVSLVRAVQQINPADYQSQANEVYNILLAPILADYKKANRLVIIPDKQIGFIPFDALVGNTIDNPKYNSLAYLVKNYTFMQHQTVGLYMGQQRHHQNTSEQFIGFAPDFDANDLFVVAKNQLRSDLQPLPYARDEVATISTLLDGEEVIGQGASEAYFKTTASSFNILHLATHAIIDEENPLYSKLVFAIADSTTNEDGELHSFEIYGLKLNASLVTLSACNTGTGKYLDGEGIFSLGRSFLLAGAKSVLTSLWEVSDLSTSQIMESFYANIKQGAASPDALRKAKLKYLKSSDPLTANPHYWAAFVYIGQQDKIYTSKRTYYWLGAILSLSIGIWAYRNRAQQKS